MIQDEPIGGTNKSETISVAGRRSDRVEISLPIEVSGTDPKKNQSFRQRGQTLVISRHGAAVILQVPLATNQQITVHCQTTNKKAEARILGLMPGQEKAFVYGIAFLNAAANPWDIDFPNLTGNEDVLSRLLLECRVCRSQKIVHLSEIEVQSFEATQSIRRLCKTCSATSLWKRIEVPWSSGLPRERQTQGPLPQTSRPANRRQHGRIQIDVPACIRQTGSPDEVVICEDLSRGGLALRSLKHYKNDTRIEVAVPFHPGSGNIFVPAKIVRVQDCGKFFKLGIAYAGIFETRKHLGGYSASTDLTEIIR